MISTAPVAMFGLTVSGERATTVPSARSTDSTRAAWATARAAGATSGSMTSWTIPERSRRSMKTRPPWSRLRAVQPEAIACAPIASAENSPH